MSHQGSRRPSVSGSPSKSGPKTGQQMVPYKSDEPKPMTEAERIGKRIDLPADAYTADGKMPTRFTSRPGFNSTGKQIQLQLNVFPIQQFQDKEIFQYDVAVSPCPPDTPMHRARALHKKVFMSPEAQNFVNANGGKWLYDGYKLAWSSKSIQNNEKRLTVDLDKDKEKKSRKGGVFYLQIKQTNVIRLAYLDQYIKGKIGWDNHVLQGMNVFDHAMRQTPSQKMMSIKRNFYPYDARNKFLGNHIVAKKGLYSAARLSEAAKNVAAVSTGLMVNVDVANTAFWQPHSIIELLLRILQEYKQKEWGRMDVKAMTQALRPIGHKHPQSGQVVASMSEAFVQTKKLQKLKFNVRHRNKMNDEKTYVIQYFAFGAQWGPGGATAKNYFFDKKENGTVTKQVSVFDHYKERWGITLQYPDLPLICSTRGGMFPMEVCNLIEFQRYNFKLNPDQTSEMIKFAVTRPNERKKDIMASVNALGWAQDPYLLEFGIKISPQMQVTNARLLQNPEIQFGGGAKINPHTSGRWDLRGKKFLKPHDKPLQSWGIVVCGNSTQKAAVEKWSQQFASVYRGHGGKISSAPVIIMVPPTVADYGTIVEKVFTDIGLKSKMRPQMICFIVANKNVLVYERIKKGMDCRYGIPSQVMQGGHITKCNPQYMSNISMKMNAKLGGVTCASIPTFAKAYFTEPTMWIGVDVSHAAPGSEAPSTAAMSVSIDKAGTRYAGACQTNGKRTEVLLPNKVLGMFKRLLGRYVVENKVAPKHVYYMRDGVAEGQFEAVLTSEVDSIRRTFRESNQAQPKITVIVATKRHHIRFFPREGDRNSADKNCNPLPGTLVERDCTHPHHWDFYLCSHVAIQGTARPVHYQVIYDDAKCQPDALQKMLYEQCYQYCRSTTPVSLHPAIYYAHLISQRSRSHERIAASQRELPTVKEGNPIMKLHEDIHPKDSDASKLDLLPMGDPKVDPDGEKFINEISMWYA